MFHSEEKIFIKIDCCDIENFSKHLLVFDTKRDSFYFEGPSVCPFGRRVIVEFATCKNNKVYVVGCQSSEIRGLCCEVKAFKFVGYGRLVDDGVVWGNIRDDNSNGVLSAGFVQKYI